MNSEKKSAVVTWMGHYVKNNVQQICKQVAVAQDILGENYRGVYDFFCDVLEKPVAYKILRARRCQVLFLTFLPIILLEEGDEIEISGEFISDNALIKYKDKMLEKSGIVVDDIVIHGRGLKEIYQLIDENFEYSDIGAFVYAKSRRAKLYDKLEAKLESYIDAFEQEWRSLSTQFVNLIYACAVPYASYVESSYENNAVFPIEGLDKNFIIINNTNYYQKLQNEASWVLFEKEPVPSIFDKLGYDCCLRVYTSNVMERTTYIPYIFIKNMCFDEMVRIIEEVCSKLPQEKAENIIHDLLEKSDDEERCNTVPYKMKLFNTLMNHIYGLYLKNKYAILMKQSNIDVPMLIMCYGEKIAEDFLNLEYQDVLDVLNSVVISCVGMNIEEDSELIDILNNINFSQSEFSKCDDKRYVKEKIKQLQEYFYQNGKIDEKLAQRGELRKKGVSLGTFYKIVDPEDAHIVSVSQVSAWDSGIASCNIAFGGDHVILSYIASGEQSFRYVLERHKKLLSDMIYAYNSPLWNQTEKTGEDLAYEIYCQYLTMLKKEDRDRKILVSFIEENLDKLKDWGIPEIFA